MWARRFLIVILVLTVLVAAGAFAVFQFGDRVLIKSAIPTGRFEAAEAGTGPDYAEASSWIARPGTREDPSRWLPDGVARGAVPGNAAIFYIHPTTYLLRDRWNAPLQPGGDAEFRTRLFAQSQSSAFNGAGDIWAPRYRQAAFGAFLLESDDARKALDLAYADVSAAFMHFLEQTGDRPVILAGHSQGALHLSRLLREQHRKVKSRLIAAYVVGWPISATADLPMLGVKACVAADQPGCVLSWLSFGDPANPELVLNAYEDSAGFSGAKRRREDLLCVNPLTGTQNGVSPPETNPGVLVPTSNLMSATLQPGGVGARCEKGLLLLEGDIPPLGPYVLPGNNYHVYDYALFWAAIRADAQRRLAAWTP
jgi:hypothetical protein